MLVSTLVLALCSPLVAQAPLPPDNAPLVAAGAVVDAGAGGVVDGGGPPTAGRVDPAARNFDFGTKKAVQAAAIDVPRALPWVALAIVVIVLGLLWARRSPTRSRFPSTGTSSPGE